MAGLRLLAVSWMVWLPCIGLSQDLRRDALVTDQDVFLMGAPQFVCGPALVQLKWSPDGEWLAVERRPNGSESAGELVVWSRASGLSKPVWAFDPRTVHIDQMSWLNGSGALVAVHTDASAGKPKTQVVDLIANGQTKTLYRGEEPAHASIATAPNTPSGQILVGGNGEMFWTVFGPTGQLGKPAEIPAPPVGGTVQLSFASRNEEPELLFFERIGTTLKGAKAFHYDRANGAVEVEPSTSFDVATMLAAMKPMLEAGTELLATDGATVRDRTRVVLRKDGRSVTVTTDGACPSVPRDPKAVLYEHLGVVLVRPLERMTAPRYAERLQDADKARAMADAQRIANVLATIIGVGSPYPTPSNWRIQVGSLLKDEALLDGFQYTYEGGKAPVDRQGTELGYVKTDSGRAVIMADFTVKWATNRDKLLC